MRRRRRRRAITPLGVDQLCSRDSVRCNGQQKNRFSNKDKSRVFFDDNDKEEDSVSGPGFSLISPSKQNDKETPNI